MRWRPDVGVGNIRVPDSSRGYHRSDTLALEHEITGANPSCAAECGGPVAQRRRGGGALNVTTKPIINYCGRCPQPRDTTGDHSPSARSRQISDNWALTKPETDVDACSNKSARRRYRRLDLRTSRLTPIGVTAIARASSAFACLAPLSLRSVGERIEKCPASASYGSVLCASNQVSSPLLSDRRLPHRLIQGCAESERVQNPLK